MIGRRGRYLRGAVLGNMGFCTSWAVDVLGRGQEWIEVVKVDLHLPNLPEEFHGRCVVHVSDLHCSRTVSSKYLEHCVDRINQLDSDIVVLTGDYITYDYYERYRDRVIDLVGGIRSRLGVYACLGNHDYGVGSVIRKRKDHVLSEMVEGMAGQGVNVLRNEASVLEVDGQKLWFVGLGDLWAGDFRPERAFADVGRDEAVITLVHNPATIAKLHEFSIDVVMCGHTHGSQLELIGTREGLAVNRRSHFSGMYQVGSKKLYVNRGLGRVGRMFFNTRPEITVFSLC